LDNRIHFFLLPYALSISIEQSYTCYIIFNYMMNEFLWIYIFCSFRGLRILAISTDASLMKREYEFHIKSSWSSRDLLRARRLSLRLSGRGGVLPLRNRTARALIFWQRSNICKNKAIVVVHCFQATERTVTNNNRLVICTDEASISATPSQPWPPPSSKSQYFTASFSSSNTCNHILSD